MNWFDHMWSGFDGPHTVVMAVLYVIIGVLELYARWRRRYSLWWWSGLSSVALTYAALTVAICAVTWDGKHALSVIPFAAIFALNVLEMWRVEREISVRRVWDAWRVAPLPAQKHGHAEGPNARGCDGEHEHEHEHEQNDDDDTEVETRGK